MSLSPSPKPLSPLYCILAANDAAINSSDFFFCRFVAEVYTFLICCWNLYIADFEWLSGDFFDASWNPIFASQIYAYTLLIFFFINAWSSYNYFSWFVVPWHKFERTCTTNNGWCKRRWWIKGTNRSFQDRWVAF